MHSGVYLYTEVSPGVTPLQSPLQFRYLAHNCRNKNKKEIVSQNKFEVIASRIMQCGVREEVKVRRQYKRNTQRQSLNKLGKGPGS